MDSYVVDALGEVTQSTDRNGNVHQYAYDVLGRITSDAVTTLGAGVDGSIRHIQYAYDSQGNNYLITSYNAASGGSIVNQVQRVYNGLGQLTGEYQSHSGAVVGGTPEVQYAYTEMSGGQNNSRLVSMTYPDGYTLDYNYNSGLDSNISRLSSISDSIGTVEAYKYLGLDTVVERDHPNGNNNETYIEQGNDPNANHDGGDQYTGLDRFGRVIDQNWVNATTGATLDRYQYGYDADSDVLYRQNLADAAMSELYTYDNLNQLTSMERGTLNATHNGIVGSPSHSQSWSPDALGNFNSVTTDGSTQTRTANQQNEITSISGQSNPTYDANGSLLSDGAGNTYVYDAWNRLVSVSNNGTVVATYAYDGLSRRIQETHSGITTDLYLSSQDQVLEEYQGSTLMAYNVWSPVYVNALIFREIGNGYTYSRYYVLQDANWNVTALTDTSANVLERYVYDAYGAITVLNPDWSYRGASNWKIPTMWQGMQYDWAVNLYITISGRVVSPTLMRPLQADFDGLGPDINDYRWEGDSPTDAVDPSGLWQWRTRDWWNVIPVAGQLIILGMEVDDYRAAARVRRIQEATRQALAQDSRQGNPDATYTNPNLERNPVIAELNRISARGTTTAGSIETVNGMSAGASLGMTYFWVREMFSFIGEEAVRQVLQNYAAGRLPQFVSFLTCQKGWKVIKNGDKVEKILTGEGKAVTKAELEAVAKEFKAISSRSRRGALDLAKERLGIPRSQQPTRQWRVNNPRDLKGPGVRDPNLRNQGIIYEYVIPKAGGGTQNVYVIIHGFDPTHGGIGHVHTGVPKPGASSVEPGGRYTETGDPIAYGR